MGLVNSPVCSYCNQEETLKHILLSCPRYHSQRVFLRHSLQYNKVPFTYECILGADTEDKDSRKKIFRFLAVFLQRTGVIHRLWKWWIIYRFWTTEKEIWKRGTHYICQVVECATIETETETENFKTNLYRMFKIQTDKKLQVLPSNLTLFSVKKWRCPLFQPKIY